ncbi:MAG: tryptophan-rich sensory protein [Chitinivibrionales bacterium]|nr:tryptophan-rich sensory protein [Chitinivibrionales bacterium]MBD3358501.1 tryptophan-rich sensory protein [Chitinivibrionales bacterium]
MRPALYILGDMGKRRNARPASPAGSRLNGFIVMDSKSGYSPIVQQGIVPMDNWYSTLNRPPLTPPSWLFSPVWTVLYVMIIVSIALYVYHTWNTKPYKIYSLIVVHSISNLMWSGIFFGLQKPGWAFLDLVILDITLVFMIYLFHHTYKPSSILLWPYLAWAAFATYLNAGFYLLNRG